MVHCKLQSERRMRISRLRSISAKLFYMTASLVVLTVAGNSWQNASMFNQQVALQAQDSTLDAAKDRSTAIEGTIDNWRTELALVVSAALGTGKSGDQRRAVEAFLDANREMIALQLFKPGKKQHLEPTLFSFTQARSTARFEGRDPDEIKTLLAKKLPGIVKMAVAKQSGDRLVIANVTNVTKLPMIALLFPYRVREGEGQYWAAAVAWTTRLVVAMPRSELTRSRLVDRHGKVLAAPQSSESPDSAADAPPAAIDPRMAGDSPTGLSTYRDASGEEWLMAFSRLETYDAAVIVEKNTRAQQLATSLIVRRSALWGWVFVLVAILFTYFGAGGITAQLRLLTATTREIASGNLKARVPAKGRDEVTVLGASVTHMAQRIESLMHEQIAKAEMQKELETAQAVQKSLFPKLQSPSSSISIAGFYQPATQCGGDWWGSYRCADGSEMVFIGDATGHGAGPALVTAMAYTCCQTIPASIEAITHQGRLSPARLLAKMNELIFDAVGGGIAMTFFVAHIDAARGILRYSNAGHAFPLLVRKQSAAADGEAPAYKEQTLNGGGMPLGMDRTTEFEDRELTIERGDYIVFYTDGLIECANAEGKQWSKRRLLANLRRCNGQGVNEFLETIRSEAFAHFGATPLSDDVTIVVTQILEACDKSRLEPAA